MKHSTNVAGCLAIACASLVAGCTTEPASPPGGSQPPENEVATLVTDPLYLAGEPGTITVEWFEPADGNCPLANHCPTEPEFLITSMTCNGCEITSGPDTGSHPPGEADISVVTRRPGSETITVVVEDAGPGQLGTRTLSRTIYADRITAFDAECWITSIIGTAPCAGTRTTQDDVMLVPVVHTAQGGSDNMTQSMFKLIPSEPEADVPGADSRNAGPDGAFAIHIPADTTASTTTIRWQVDADETLTVTVPIPPLFH
ncbi:MAG TPA: hypothetical protein VHT91_27745 [Kofleriaceae bacterium]|jgi:hypothetical protein|nr:hypothetical protein [Kofleriaceae bacterium]